MPYIAENARPAYDDCADRLVSSLPSDDWRPAAATFLRQLLEGVYGSVDDTRYFRQNEMIGVLACMASEWARRMDLANSFSHKLPQGSIMVAIPELQDVLKELLRTIPMDDDAQRAGHLNYFITVLMIKLCDLSRIHANEVPGFVLAVADYLYQEITGPYEDGAIARNGDVFPGNRSK